ncbi:uncharacterized protein LOC123902509 [Trifolium pratense]|uniref:Uncharacterized protein n=1 Tax=Trifolium pratense TaxID=57577 RepID=A0ACB0I760_TRIPR|nr:uncharacterized protein LOC123902509 [Trifolium pratense]CAJ2627936.1 unnamed protein product [Trifolium pratense]
MTSVRRNTFPYRFQVPKVEGLVALEDKLTPASKHNFQLKYGLILDLLHVKVDPEALITLVQHYDPPLRCFTFQDFQLFPTLEEFESFMNLKMEGQICYLGNIPSLEEIAIALHMGVQEVPPLTEIKRNSSGSLVRGFAREVLEVKAQDALTASNWETYNAILALLIYGLVLFPKESDFIDLPTIRVFLTKNPVPTLLADFLYSLHDRRKTRRGGPICCCVPLIYLWLKSHLPKKGPFAEKNMPWSQRLRSLSEKDVVWYSRRVDSSKVLLQCGDFPNVPLIGTLGCINHNPILSLLQLGYTMESEPKANLLSEIFFKKGENEELLKKIRLAWGLVLKKTMGKKNCIAMPSYTQWVKDRIQEIKLPFGVITPIEPQKPTPVMTVPIEEAKALKDQIVDLKKKNEELQSQYHEALGKLARKKRDCQEQEELVQDNQKRLKESEEKRMHIGGGLKSAEGSIMAKKEKIADVWHSNQELRKDNDLLWKALQKRKSECHKKDQESQEIAEMYKKCLQDVNAEGQKFKELFIQEELKNRQMQEDRKMYEDSMIKHMEYSETQKNLLARKIDEMEVELNMHKEEIKEMRVELSMHKKVLNLVKHDAVRFQKGFTDLINLSHQTMDELPQRLRIAEIELPFFNAPEGIRNLMGYCRKTLDCYKKKLIRARKGL